MASIAVADLQNTKREFHREWRRREVEYETTVRDLERRASNLNARLSAASDDVERALSSRSKTIRDVERDDESERISFEIVAAAPSSPSSFLERSLRERLDAQRAPSSSRATLRPLSRSTRDGARNFILSRCTPDTDADADAALTARAREHRARAEAVACALAEPPPRSKSSSPPPVRTPDARAAIGPAKSSSVPCIPTTIDTPEKQNKNQASARIPSLFPSQY